MIPADTLRILIAVRRIPLKSAIAIREGNATTEIPLDDVVQIERKVGKHGKLIGFLVGAAADVTIVAVATSNMNFFPDNFSLLGK